MAELAKHEAEIEHRTLALKREGFWSLKRISRVTEPVRPKVHWDYLCEEMQWLSADFAQERRWKRGVARKLVRMVMRHHEEQRQKEEKIKREEQAKLRRVASSIAKEVRAFWSNVEKVVQFKQQSRLEEKRKKALDLHLDFIVGQTERYSDLLSQSLGDPGVPVSVSSRALLHPETAATALKGPQQYLTDEDDGDFEPLYEEDDDEETIEVEEQQEGNDAETHKREIELLRQEGSLPLEQLLQTLTHAQVLHGAHRWPLTFMVCCHAENLKSNRQLLQSDFWYLTTSLPSTAKDEEETIEAQEIVEGDTDHSEELGDLAREGRLCGVSAVLYLVNYCCGMVPPATLHCVHSASACVFQLPVVVYLITSEVDFRFFGKFWFIHRPTIFHLFSDSSGEVDSGEAGEGMEVLLKGGDYSPPGPTISRPKKEISHIAATAESLQPKGYTLATTQVKTPIPFLLHGTLREYQHIGLDWLVTMYEKKLNGILADEMGLGKTIQTIALLAHLACEKGNWGPHLIIVPTSVMLNWEMELKRWCPSFKILTYYGSQKERKLKRQGWTKPNAFHVCITSYKLVLQDHQAFRRKSWRYLILDEAQNIKNFKSQRWQSLLNFNSQRRLLLTGTPLQNSLMELWSLMHFLMPHVFQSHREFKEWFSNPLTGMIEGSQEYNEGLVKRLHKVLRPFLLRRIKADVEKQMPKKYEHVVRCRLSKRQRFLYDDFMAQASTRETLASGHFMSVINILMQLRKVCNHPNLFDPRPIQSPFITAPIVFSTASLVLQALDTAPFERCDLSMFDLVGLEGRVSRYQADIFVPRRKVTAQLVQEIMDSPDPLPRPKPVRMKLCILYCARLPPPTVPPSPLHPSGTTTVTVCTGAGPTSRPGAPVPLLTVRPPAVSSAPPPTAAFTPTPSTAVTQRVLLSPDMQARLPSGEVVSIAQLASLAGRPVSSQGSKPVTFQLQGNKLTLSGAPLHQGAAPQHRPIQGNVLHLVSSGGQHHLVGQQAQVAMLQSVSQSGGGTVNSHPPVASSGLSTLTLPLSSAQGTMSLLLTLFFAGQQTAPSGNEDSSDVITVRMPAAPSPSLLSGGPSSLRVRPQPPPPPRSPFYMSWLENKRKCQREERLSRILQVNERHCSAKPVYGCEVLDFLTFLPKPILSPVQTFPGDWARAIHTTEERLQLLRDVIERFIFVIPPVEAPPISMHTCHPPPSMAHQQAMLSSTMSSKFAPFFRCLHRIQCNMRTHFPDLRLIQYDCGKLQTLHSLLRRLKTGGHRVLIFTQMTRMLDVLEQFLNYHGHIYLRLDGSTRVEQRQALMERFNADQRIFCFILSTRSGGVGVNLTGADTVVFYDSDWNPTMDAQAQDRCHRIGQTRDVHIYRLISERTVEENILKKANQKRMLGDMAIEGGNFTTAFFKQQTIRELFDVSEGDKKEEPNLPIQVEEDDPFNKQQTTILEQALCRAEDEEDIVAASQAKAEQVAELAEFNESIPLEEGSEGMGREQEEEELSKAEQEIAALVEQLTPIERYAMNFLEASLEDVCKEELKQAEEQVEAARKGLDQAKEEGLKLPTPSDNEDEEFLLSPGDSLPVTAVRRPRKHKEKGAPSTRVSGRLRGAVVTPDMDLASIERFREQGPESQNLERDLTSTNLTHSLPTPHCHKTTPVTVVPKQDLLTLPLPTEGDVSKSVCCVHDTEGTKEVAVPVANSPSGKDSRNSQIHNQLCSSSPATDKCANPAEVSSVPSASELGSGAHSATSSLPESTLIPPVALSPVAKKIQITHAQCALSTSHSFSEGESKDQAQSDSGRVPTDTVSQTQLELTTKKDAKLEESLSAGSEVGNICKIQSDSTQRQNSDSVTPTKDQDEQIQKSLKSPNSVQPALARSPRKRQSADGEVLSSHTDDSPSAKVLRKLPGRLVTVVEDKEPRRKKRAAGGGEEIRLTEMEQSEDGKASHMHDTAGTAKKENKSDPEAFPTTHFLVCQSDQNQDSPSTCTSSSRGVTSYSPTHLSDMPVLRNLPVRRRLETESRMAAQLGDQHLGRWRGKGGERKTSSSPNFLRKLGTKLEADEETVTPELNTTPLGKRKRGRPPKTPPRVAKSQTERTSPCKAESTSTSERNPSPSPKRKRGRPRKDLAVTPEVEPGSVSPAALTSS
uniref:Snf2-related CREBBP activator protein n=1 Tax=Scleropages formosus TaxID=113540 RepID=A0A8C9T9Y0_SCLFO